MTNPLRLLQKTERAKWDGRFLKNRQRRGCATGCHIEELDSGIDLFHQVKAVAGVSSWRGKADYMRKVDVGEFKPLSIMSGE